MFQTVDEDDSSEFLVQALPVQTFRNDLNAPPCTGEEYLFSVRQEAAKYPDVVIADIKDLKTKEQTKFVEIVDNKVPEELLPNVDWQRKMCSDFSKLRLQIDKKRETFIEKSKKKKLNLPKLEDKRKWHGLFFEDPQSELSLNEPLLSLLYKLDQATILQLLEYHTGWFEEQGYSEISCKWLYALMAFVEKPLLPETYWFLRQLATTAIELRLKIDKNDSIVLNSLNLLISLVGKYFEQRDLA